MRPAPLHLGPLQQDGRARTPVAAATVVTSAGGKSETGNVHARGQTGNVHGQTGNVLEHGRG